MVSTSPSSRITTPLPIRSVPRIPAVKASSGTSERNSTIESSAASKSKRNSSALGCISGGNAQLLRSAMGFPAKSRPSFYGRARLRVSSRAIISRYTLAVEDGHEHSHQHRDGFQSKDLADFRRQGEAGRDHADTELRASVGTLLAAAALCRFRRLRDVVFLADHGKVEGRRPLGRPSDFYDEKVFSCRDPGAKGFRDRSARRLEGTARRRSRIPADRCALDAGCS